MSYLLKSCVKISPPVWASRIAFAYSEGVLCFVFLAGLIFLFLFLSFFKHLYSLVCSKYQKQWQTISILIQFLLLLLLAHRKYCGQEVNRLGSKALKSDKDSNQIRQLCKIKIFGDNFWNHFSYENMDDVHTILFILFYGLTTSYGWLSI